MLDEPGILSAISVHLVVLDERNGFEPAADGDAHAVVDDLLRGRGDRHEARGALPVDRHAGDAGRKAGAQQRLAGDIAALRSLLQRGAHHHVVDLAGVDGRALERVRDRMPAERLGLGVVERAAIGLADRRARGGDDDGFTHDGSPRLRFISLRNPHPSRLRRATFSPREKALAAPFGPALRLWGKAVCSAPSPSGRRWPEGPDEGLLACAKIVSSTPSRFWNYLVVPEAKHLPAFARQIGVTGIITKAFCVLRAVGLDDQLSPNAKKVDNVRIRPEPAGET